MSKDYRNTRRYWRIQNGFCGKCGTGREGNGSTATMCAECAAERREATKRKRLQLKKRGRCRECKRPRGEDGSATYCRPCADKLNTTIKTARAELYAQGLCRCGAKRDGNGSLCFQCRVEWSIKDRARNASRKAAPATLAA